MKDIEENKKRFNIRHLLVIIVILIIIIAVIISVKHFTLKKEYSPQTALANELPRFRLIDMDDIGDLGDRDNDGINDQKDIMLGAKKQLEEPAGNIYLEEDELNYYKEGDPPEGLALSTDIIARAFMKAGFDLREMVYEDIKNNFGQYPLREIWGQTVCDKNIDYRRIQNLEVFFMRNAESLDILFDCSRADKLERWLPGDVIFFDMDGDGFSDTAGIISDSTTREGIPKIIYNHIDPGYTTEKDILREEIITGHYRFPE
ncbi:MAG: DUF1287 domain-containing protein [Actinomycetota bacterium]|nr:DUF1287 domain-containing protein [Actinomycetota bacterium]